MKIQLTKKLRKSEYVKKPDVLSNNSRECVNLSSFLQSVFEELKLKILDGVINFSDGRSKRQKKPLFNCLYCDKLFVLSRSFVTFCIIRKNIMPLSEKEIGL